MSKKPLLSESQVAKWMKLANIDKNATENFLTENKKNKKVLKEMYGDDPENVKNPFRIISAYNYQQLSPKYEKTLDPFKKFAETKIQQDQNLKDLIIEQQRKLSQ